MSALLIRNVEIDGRAGLDVRIEGRRIAEIGVALRSRGDAIDGVGGALIPGLADHHIHLLATAARRESLALDDVADLATLAQRIGAAVSARPAGSWLRATGLAPALALALERGWLDRVAPRHPVRVQDQSGALWIVNAAALDRLGRDDLPPEAERGAHGCATGRLWRADAWLRGAIGSPPPALTPLGAELASYGVTTLTDASVTTDASAAALLAEANRDGALPQRLTLMSAGPLVAPEDGAFAVGPVKILPDDRDLPLPDAIAAMIRSARREARRVAVHCVTAGELAVTLAGFAEAGALPGDRIEHGGLIAADAIPTIAALSLTVVTQPGFVAARGDRYRRDVEPAEHPDLYRCASLIAAGVPVASSSDAPYGPLDPWATMRAAVDRRTADGAVLGEQERVSPGAALGLHLGSAVDPAGPPRRVAVGAPADVCLLRVPLAEALSRFDASLVRATIVAGCPVYIATA